MVYEPIIAPCSWCGQLGYTDEFLKFDGTYFCCEDHRKAYEDSTKDKDDLFPEDPE